MIDINLLRQQPELIKKALVNRQKDPSLADNILDFDEKRRKLSLQVEDLRSKQNSFNRNLKGKPSEEQLREITPVKESLKKLEVELKEIEEKQNLLLEEIPNLPANDVPIGKDDQDNPVIKTVGQLPVFDFKSLDHADLGEKLDILDVKKISINDILKNQKTSCKNIINYEKMSDSEEKKENTTSLIMDGIMKKLLNESESK
jgi:seryl-tRNA synthetase